MNIERGTAMSHRFFGTFCIVALAVTFVAPVAPSATKRFEETGRKTIKLEGEEALYVGNKRGDIILVGEKGRTDIEIVFTKTVRAESEAEAKKRGHEVTVGKFPFAPLGKARIMQQSDGFVKIVAERATGEILGASLVGPEVTELLPELVLARTWELTPEEIARTVHAHPTLSEALMEAAHGVFGKPIHL